MHSSRRPCLAHLLVLWSVAFGVAPSVVAQEREVTLIPSAEDAAQVRVDLAQRAQKEFFVISYVFAEDEAGMASLTLMREAAKRGVDVRVVVDGFAAGQKPSAGLVQALADEGVSVRFFRPLQASWHPLRLLKRTHEKLQIRDGEEFVTGGRNVANAYFGHKEASWEDMDVFVRDKAVTGEARDRFLEMWDNKETVTPTKVADLDAVSRAKRKLDIAWRVLQRTDKIKLNSDIDWSKRGRQVASLKFLHDSNDKRASTKDGTARGVLDFLASAQKSIDIETAYLVPTSEVMTVLKQKLNAGVKVRILTNSPESNNQAFVAAVYESGFEQLKSFATEIYENVGPTLHSKYMIVDGARVAVTSYNLNRRSQNLDYEVGVVIDDPEIAKQASAEFQARVNRARVAVSRGEVRQRMACFSTTFQWISGLLMGQL